MQAGRARRHVDCASLLALWLGRGSRVRKSGTDSPPRRLGGSQSPFSAVPVLLEEVERIRSRVGRQSGAAVVTHSVSAGNRVREHGVTPRVVPRGRFFI